MKEDKPEPKILKREVITDQSDPRMVEFRKSYGEFQYSCKRKTVRLEIIEYEINPGKTKRQQSSDTTKVSLHLNIKSSFASFLKRTWTKTYNYI